MLATVGLIRETVCRGFIRRRRIGEMGRRGEETPSPFPCYFFSTTRKKLAIACMHECIPHVRARKLRPFLSLSLQYYYVYHRCTTRPRTNAPPQYCTAYTKEERQDDPWRE